MGGGWLEHLVGDHFVSLIQEYSFWGNLFGVEGEGHDGDDLAGADEVGGGSVDHDVTGFGFAGDDVGFESSTAGDAGDEHFFADPEVNGLHEVGGNGDAAFVIDVGIGDASAVDFGFELMAKHGPERWTQWLMGQGEPVFLTLASLFDPLAYLLSLSPNHGILEYYPFFAPNPMIPNAFLLFSTYRTFRNN